MENAPGSMQPIRHILKQQGLVYTPHPQSIKTETVYQCPKCQDAKLVHPCTPDGKVNYEEVVPCRYCIEPNYLRKYLGVSSLDATFDNFNPVKGTEEAYKRAMELVSLKSRWKILLIYGENGNGKTHLLEATALELWSKGIAVKVITFPDFIAGLKSTFDRSKDSKDPVFEERIQSICQRQYLILDDVGSADSFTQWSLGQLDRILLARYRDNLFTMMTTNLDWEELPQFIVSRMRDGEKARMVLNQGVDYRPTKGVR